MANQKEYKIIINGIKESIDGIGTLQDSLDKLGKKVEESGSEMKAASKGMDELAKTEEKIRNYNEEYATALAANKAVLADHNKEVKAKLDLEKAEITVQEGLTDTYAHKQQLLTALGKVIKNTTGDTSALKAQYAQLNQELKDFDAELGNHQRNVGDYEIATKGLKVQLKEMQTEMANMLANGVDKADPKFVELAKKAGSLKDAIGDAGEEINRFASDTKKLDDVIDIAKSATAAFELYKGAMSAFGVETESTEKAMQKLMGAMSIIQSLKTLQETLNQNSATAKIFSKAMTMMGLSMDGATKASKLLRIGLASIGIGLIIGLVMTLIEYWDDIKQSFMNTFPILKTLSDKFNGLSGVIKGVGYAIKHWLMNPIETMAKALKKLFKGDLTGALKEIKDGFINQFKGLKTAFLKGVEDSRQKVVEEADKTSKSVTGKAKETVDTTKKYLDDWVKANKQAQEEVDKANKAAYEAELKRQEKLKVLRKDYTKAEQDWQKQYLKLQLANAKTEEEKIEIRKKIIDLDEKIALEEKKIAAADAMGISVEEINKRLTTTEGTYLELNDEQKQILQTLITQLSTVKMAADEARSALGGGESSDGSTGDSGSTNPLLSWFNDDVTQEFMALGQETFDVLADSISTMMDWAIEEAENALDEISELHDKAVDRIEESQNKISELKSEMKDANSAELEAFKEQMADEMAMLVQREAEEKRLQKEKEKREKELEKKKKQQRKAELAAQMVEAIASTALSVAKTFSQWGWPLGAVFGAIMSALGTVQVAIIAKQMSKLADGGLLSGPSHANGGIPVGNTGIEVEGGEYVVNKRSTAKYLPLLQSINEEGARKKTVANQIGKMADGGTLNYERINSNLDSLSTASIVASAIGSIDFHPYVSVVDINRGQRNYTEVRQLAGANS